MSLVADYSSGSESDDDSSSNSDKNEDDRTDLKPALPSASDLLSGEKTGLVFNNPYKEAEKAKIALLERHVKMVDNHKPALTKNGKKICWNFQKGRCRFGSNCTFAHDSDLFLPNNEEEKPNKNSVSSKATISKSQSGLQLGTNERKRTSTEDESSKSSRKVSKSYKKQHN
uniref:C3H1-type domain-containing protein n=1 Tax=Tabanus bromius TaxID=304241 RepID=A0A0K8TMF0_TABBR